MQYLTKSKDKPIALVEMTSGKTMYLGRKEFKTYVLDLAAANDDVFATAITQLEVESILTSNNALLLERCLNDLLKSKRVLKVRKFKKAKARANLRNRFYLDLARKVFTITDDQYGTWPSELDDNNDELADDGYHSKYLEDLKPNEAAIRRLVANNVKFNNDGSSSTHNVITLTYDYRDRDTKIENSDYNREHIYHKQLQKTATDFAPEWSFLACPMEQLYAFSRNNNFIINEGRDTIIYIPLGKIDDRNFSRSKHQDIYNATLILSDILDIQAIYKVLINYKEEPRESLVKAEMEYLLNKMTFITDVGPEDNPDIQVKSPEEIRAEEKAADEKARKAKRDERIANAEKNKK